MNELELRAWNSVKEIIFKFLENFKDSQYAQTVKTVLEKLLPPPPPDIS
jgi:hypothetical protein